MESGGTQGNGEPIDSEERRAVGGDNAIEAAALQAAPKDTLMAPAMETSGNIALVAPFMLIRAKKKKI